MLITLLRWPPRRRRNCTGSRTAPKSYLSDAQWFVIADLFPHPPVGPAGGRPWVPPRPCLEGVLWVLFTGARWKDLPPQYPSPCTCWRRHRDWTRNGVFRAAWDRLLGNLFRRRGIDWEEAVADGSFARAKKGVPRSAAAARGTAPTTSC